MLKFRGRSLNNESVVGVAHQKTGALKRNLVPAVASSEVDTLQLPSAGDWCEEAPAPVPSLRLDVTVGTAV